MHKLRHSSAFISSLIPFFTILNLGFVPIDGGGQISVNVMTTALTPYCHRLRHPSFSNQPPSVPSVSSSAYIPFVVHSSPQTSSEHAPQPTSLQINFTNLSNLILFLFYFILML